MKKKKTIIVLAVVAVAAVGIGFGVYNYNRSSEDEGGIPRNAVPVQLEAVKTDTVRQQITARGIVELADRHTVFPKGQGRVSEVLVKKGDLVTVGQIIARYDAESLVDLNDQLSEANLALRSAELALQSAMLPVVSRIELTQAETGIVQAQQVIEDVNRQIEQYDLNLAQIDGNISRAERAHESTRLLYERGAASRQELDVTFENVNQLRDQRSTVEAQRQGAVENIRRAEENVVRAEEQYSLILEKETDPSVANRVEQQRLQVEQSRLRISMIRHQIDKFIEEEISEYGGVVLELTIQPGETATAARPLMTVADVDADNLIVKVNVPESDAVDLSVGLSAELRGNAFDGSYAATVGKIAPIVEEQVVNNSIMRVLVVEIVPTEDAPLRAGYTVEAVITTRVAESAVVVPLMATLSSENGEDFVYVMRDDFSLEQRIITLGGYTGMFIEVRDGIAEGERVVVNPSPALRDGLTVRPVGTIQ